MENEIKENAAAEEAAEKTEPFEATVQIETDGGLKEFSASQLTSLFEKAAKYDLISEDIKMLKAMAAREDKSISQYLNSLEEKRIESRRRELMKKCGDDALLVESILALENDSSLSTAYGFAELNRFYPEIKSIEDVPKAVTEAAKVKGTCLLDEYLRYSLKNRREMSSQVKNAEKAMKASVGSQREFEAASYDPAKAEFIKALWGR